MQTYYLTYRNFDTGLLFGDGRKWASNACRQRANELFDEFGKYGAVQVLARIESEGPVVDRYDPEPF